MALGDLSEKQLLGLTAGVVGAILLVMAGILLWIYIRYKGLVNDTKTKGAIALTMEAKTRDLKDVEETFTEEMTRFHKVLQRVPETSLATDLDAQISGQAESAKLKILLIEQVKEKRGRTKKKSAKAGKLEAIRIRVEAVGSFNAFGQFLNNIERNMDRFIAVTGFTITAYESGLVPGKRSHEITLDLVTYRYIGGKKSAKAAGPATARR